jgi:anti-sigma factor RsiW
MMHDEISELLGAYALDAVEPHERDEIEEHLLSCARCRAEVADHREVAALLAHGGADAPADLWDRIAGSLEEAPPRLDLAPVADLAAARARRSNVSRIGSAVAVAAALLIAFLGVQVRSQDQRIDQLQTALSDPMKPAYEAALGDPGAKHFALTSSDGRYTVRGVVAADGVAYIGAEALPKLAADRTYQLWGAAGDELVSLGVLGEDPKVISFPVDGDGYKAFAITEEASPGVVRSRNQPVVAGSVTA